MIALVPPILVFLAKHPACDKFDLSSMEAIICGAAPAGREICEEAQKRYPKLRLIRQGKIMDYLEAAKSQNTRHSRSSI